MAERKPTDSEHLRKLEDEEAREREEHGILEIFERAEDEPLSRDHDHEGDE